MTYAGLNKEQQYAAITAAATVAELDRMWADWSRSGYGREGLLFAALLARKAELGAALTDDEQALVDEAPAKAAYGASLTPITGLRGPGYP